MHSRHAAASHSSEGPGVPAHLSSSLPTIALYNNVETFLGFLNRAEDRSVLESRHYRGDRALFWLGDPKLVFVTAPIPHTDYVREHLGYPGTRVLSPAEPSPWLSLDIVREAHLREAVLAYAGPGRAVRLIPYATTPEFLHLAQVLRKEHGLTVYLPETPAPEALWLRDYVDTKAGFRVLASRWLPNADQLLPQGVICRDAETAADAALWFHQHGRVSMVKADNGESGLGHTILPLEPALSLDHIQRQLQHNPYLRDNLIVVEEYVDAAVHLSPSLELFVPPLGQGEPHITYLSQQLFRGFGQFSGVLVSREQLAEPWYPTLAESGLTLARQLQAEGYVGHFDIDAVVDDAHRIWLLEVNSRRTGGTYVHEFAVHTFGPNYLDSVALLSHAKLPSGNISTVAELLAALGDLRYPINGDKRGVVVAVTSALAAHEFGCIIVAGSTAEALHLQAELLKRVQR